MSFAILLLLILAAGLALVGLVGLVLVIVGIVKRSAVMGIIGAVCLLLLIGLLVLAVPVGLWMGMRVWHHAPHMAPSAPEAAVASESPHFHKVDPHHARLTMGGVEIDIEEPGGTGTSASSQIGRTWGRGFHVRHEATVGDVDIAVGGEDGRLTLSVDGADYGRVRPGDRVRITASREVTVNGQPRGRAGRHI